MNASFYARAGKRSFDVCCALLGVVLLAPVFLFIALLVLTTSGRPIIFRQERVGRYGKSFFICKFRTMANVPSSGDESLLTASGDTRVTRLGRWLRRTKCDELPQIWNVLRGDMSLVGPRPEVPYFTGKFTPRQRAVLEVRPGITGPAATHYIAEEQLLASHPDKELFYVNELLPAKLEKDLRYAEHVSFNTDLKLIANTFLRLLMKSRVSES